MKKLFNKILLVFVASGLTCLAVFILTAEHVKPIDTSLEILEVVLCIFLLYMALYIIIFFNRIIKTLEM